MIYSWDIPVVTAALKTWAETYAEIPFTWDDYAAPMMSHPFGLLKIISGPVAKGGIHATTYEYDDEGGPGEEMILSTTNQGVLTVSVQTYSLSQLPTANAWVYIESLRSALSSPSKKILLTNAGIAPSRVPSIVDLSDIVGQQYRSRASMTIDFNIALNLTETETYIEYANLNGEVEDGTETIEYEDVWIPEDPGT